MEESILHERPKAGCEAANIARRMIGNSAAPIPPFAALRAFEMVFRAGGIRKAALQLKLNHAVVSRHIRLLEDWVGIPLVLRSGNRLVLSDDGSQFHDRISAALAEIEMATCELLRRRDEQPLKVWCVPGFATQWLSAELARFEREFPGNHIELRPTDVEAKLSIYEADADIRYRLYDKATAKQRGVRVSTLAQPELLPLANPSLAQKLESTEWRDSILNWPFLHDTDDSEWRSWLLQNGHEPPEMLPGMLCWHSHLTIAAAREGRGVVLASRFLVHADLKQGTLVQIKVNGAKPIAVGCYSLFAREDRWSNPVLSRLRQFLRDRAAVLLQNGDPS